VCHINYYDLIIYYVNIVRMSIANLFSPNNDALYCGSLNTSNLVSGNSLSATSINNWSARTVGTTPVIVFSFTPKNNTSAYVENYASCANVIPTGYAGFNIAQVLYNNGTATPIPSLFIQNQNGNVGLAGCTLLLTNPSSTVVSVQVTGIAGQTLTWSGTTLVVN
jgi:hypothetical protein